MGQSISATALGFCRYVADGGEQVTLTNADVKFGAWLIGAASLTGGFPLELTNHQIRQGFERNEVAISGLGSRHETVATAIQNLVDAGIIEVEDGKSIGYGHRTMIFNLAGA